MSTKPEHRLNNRLKLSFFRKGLLLAYSRLNQCKFFRSYIAIALTPKQTVLANDNISDGAGLGGSESVACITNFLR